MIPFDSENYFIGMWFVYPPSQEHMDKYPNVGREDWMATMFIDKDKNLVMMSRFHSYTNPLSPSDGQRNWSCCKSTETQTPELIEEGVGIIEMMAKAMVERNDTRVSFIKLDCNGEEAVEILEKEADWFHKAVDIEAN